MAYGDEFFFGGEGISSCPPVSLEQGWLLLHVSLNKLMEGMLANQELQSQVDREMALDKNTASSVFI